MSGNTRQDVRYTWDAGGNVASRYDVKFLGTETFTCDFLDRLTAVSGAYTRTYTYNAIGNILTEKIGTNPTTNYTYGTRPHAVTQVGSTAYTYDNNGNMITKGSTTTFSWNVENRLSSETISGSTSTFVYDGDGNRIKKTEGGQTTIYIGKYYEKNITTSVVTTYYYLGGKLVALRNGPNLRYIHLDLLGSTSVVTNSSGAQYGYTRYYPYGSTRDSGGSLDTDKKFTGQRLDSTGLYYYGARYYDPVIGRFISPDSIIPNPSNPQALNRYSYALNNPLIYIDPTGHFSLHSVGSFFKGVGSAAVNTVKATAQMVVNPVQTAQAIAHAVTNPVGTVKAIAADYAAKAGSAEGIGSIFGEFLIMAVTSGVGGGAGVGGKVIASVTEKSVAKQLTFGFMKESALSGKVSGLVIGRTSDLAKAGALATGEYQLGWLSVLGNPTLGVEAEKTINFLKLWKVTELGMPIRDATDIAVKEGTFLQMERAALSQAGWEYNMGHWIPPIP